VSPLAVPFPTIPPIAGVEMATATAGFYKHERPDLLVMHFPKGASCAGVFTRHGVGSAPVDWCQAALDKGAGRAKILVVNAGCANSFTGAAGAEAARFTAETATSQFGGQEHEVMLASTGVIGVVLDASLIEAVFPIIADGMDADRWSDAAAAIMTTDTFAKGAYVEAEIGGTPVKLAGIAKGSGMIAPDMATMLAFLVTDADVAPEVLDALLKAGVADTFNSVTVDGDRSTNDTCLLFATGASGAPRIETVDDPRLAPFRDALNAALLDLAQQLVRDGEGATKFVKVEITGADSDASARKIARTVCESPLVKTALAGEDANWGRIVMAVGRADVPVVREKISVRFGELWAAKDGAVSRTYDEVAMSAYMKKAELDISIEVGAGGSRAVMWTCDLTKRYVEINGDYRS
jgi:glutamate N-acetyltransferase/amino-acid N-acetyltransferase